MLLGDVYLEHWHFAHGQKVGSKVSAMAYDDDAILVDDYWLVKAKSADAIRDLVNLLLRVLLGVLPVRLYFCDGSLGYIHIGWMVPLRRSTLITLALVTFGCLPSF